MYFSKDLSNVCFEQKKKHAPANDASSPSEEEPEPVVTPKPVIHEKPAVVKELTTHSNSSAIPPKAPTPPPAPILGPTAPKVLPPREPSPELPEVLREFLDREWFQQLYPEKKVRGVKRVSSALISPGCVWYFSVCVCLCRASQAA